MAAGVKRCDAGIPDDLADRRRGDRPQAPPAPPGPSAEDLALRDLVQVAKRAEPLIGTNPARAHAMAWPVVERYRAARGHEEEAR